MSVSVRRSEAHYRIAERDPTWVSSTVWPVGDQLQRLRQRLLGAGEQQVAVVDQPAQVVPGALEGAAQLVDDDPQVRPVSIEPTNWSRSSSICSTGIGMLVRSCGMTMPSVRYGLAVAVRPQDDVLLPHRAAGRHDRLGVGRDAGRSGSIRSVTRTPSSISSMSLTRPDPDAAVGDLGVDEDAAGVGEVGGDRRSPAPSSSAVEPDVVEPEVGHAQHAPRWRRRAA